MIMSTQTLHEGTGVETLAYDYKRQGLKRIKLEGTVYEEKSQKRYVLKMGVKILGYYYPNEGVEGVTKDEHQNSVGTGNLFAGLLLLAQLLTDE